MHILNIHLSANYCVVFSNAFGLIFDGGIKMQFQQQQLRISMFRILTQDAPSRHHLQSDFISSDGSLMASPSQIQPIIELVRSITYEYFHNDLPILAKKMREFATETLTMTFSIDLYREIMGYIRKLTEILTFHQDYMTAVNRELQFQDIGGNTEDNSYNIEERVKAFQEAIQQRSSIRENVGDIQLQIESRIDGKAQTTTEKTEKTMQSEIIEADNSTFLENPFNKFTQFFKNSIPLSTSRHNDKTTKKMNDSSMQLKAFEKKGGSVLENNFEVLLRGQIEDDLKRQALTIRNEGKHWEVQQFRYNRLIKDGLMNGKLKNRKKKK